MAPQRLSRLQKRILLWLDADGKRTRYTVSPSYQELVQEMRSFGYDTGNVSKSVRNLESKGLIEAGRTAGSKTENLRLTRTGKNVCQILQEVVIKDLCKINQLLVHSPDKNIG